MLPEPHIRVPSEQGPAGTEALSCLPGPAAFCSEGQWDVPGCNHAWPARLLCPPHLGAATDPDLLPGHR